MTLLGIAWWIWLLVSLVGIVLPAYLRLYTRYHRWGGWGLNMFFASFVGSATHAAVYADNYSGFGGFALRVGVWAVAMLLAQLLTYLIASLLGVRRQ